MIISTRASPAPGLSTCSSRVFAHSLHSLHSSWVPWFSETPASLARLGQSRCSERALPRGKASLLSAFSPNTKRGCGQRFRRVSELASCFMRLRCYGPTECRRPHSGNRVGVPLDHATEQKSNEHRTLACA